ncbi:MAG: DUF3306 domain-containing protein [Sulfitobacter sp.]
MTTRQDYWARRRAGVAAEAQAEQDAVKAQVLAREQAAFDNMSEADVLAALDLPDPDTLVQGDNFAAFMAKAVPDQIRRRALRTLWRSNPVLANVDMLVDYGEDFTDAAMAVENIQTAYQVGKGMLKHVEEMARQAEELANPKTPETVEEDVEEKPVTAQDVEAEADVLVEMSDIAAPDEDETCMVPAPRRMKFRTEETA